MPIEHYPFTQIAPDFSRPMLWIRVSNAHSDTPGILVRAVVDTGADECAFPASIATQLGHQLHKGVTRKTVRTASGKTQAFSHTSRVEVLTIRADGLPGTRVLYTLPETPIDFIQGCESFLLGSRNFLKPFVLTIDYPAEVFSIQRS
jgi:predicted aspartyl protease